MTDTAVAAHFLSLFSMQNPATSLLLFILIGFSALVCEAQTSTFQEMPEDVAATVQRPVANNCMQGPIAITSCFCMALFASAFFILTIKRPDLITVDLVGKPVTGAIGAGGFLGLFYVFYLIAKLVMKGC